MSRRQAHRVKFDASLVLSRRLALGLTQEDLAHEARVTLRTAQRWEKGINAPNGAQLLRLAKALKIEHPDELYADDPVAA